MVKQSDTSVSEGEKKVLEGLVPQLGLHDMKILVECRTLWCEPEKVHIQNIEQLHAVIRM